ncbi:MAG: UDP-N-acetylmuramoyl-tripeptide--D-alanyl-D-alanine ligase [Mediterranea massiliensis]|nr:UDP-N-acetylmuramoyl-tripeptide--D-alanyl-D-alanine ligase [Mediterranea massiliensis]
MEVETLYQHFLACNGVTTDSRNCPEGSMFFALKGENFNGNAFAAKALESGCRYAVIDEEQYIPAHNDKRYIVVDNCLLALQQLARLHRRTLNIPVIGITGTNGKTTTKELMAAVLSTRYNLLYTQGNLNNHIGVPLTLLCLKPTHNLAVIEMGASHPGDIKELVEIAEPNFGLITNVGKAHLQGFGSLEGVIQTKGELYEYLRSKPDSLIFIDDDNAYLKKIAGNLKQIGYGSSNGLSISGWSISNSPYLTLEWQEKNCTQKHTISTRLIGEYNLTNALAAVCVGRYFNVDAAQIEEALSNYMPQNNRSQLKQTADNTLIIDAYNANPTSMRASIGNFHKMDAPNKWLILGDMRELGEESASEHQQIVNYLEECGFEEVILVGDQFGATTHHYTHYPDVKALIEFLKLQKPTQKTLLIKGSNGIRLNSVVEYL